MLNLPDEQIKIVDELLNQALIARMATADNNGQPHVVPVWFGWDGESMWISSYSNTRKVQELEKNSKISISVDVTGGKGETRAVILEGKVELVKDPREFLRKQFYWIYKRYLGEEGVMASSPQEWIEDPHNLLIKLTPYKVYTWN